MDQNKPSITISVQSLLDITKVLGGREVSVSVPRGCTVKELFRILIQRWGDDLAKYIFDPHTGDLLDYMKFMVNGRSINLLDKQDTVLKDEDIFLIFPPVGGG